MRHHLRGGTILGLKTPSLLRAAKKLLSDLPRDTDFSRFPRATNFPTREVDGVIWIFTG